MMLEKKGILADFLGDACRGCSGKKRPKQSHCSVCYHRLPRHMQLDLYRKFGFGYEEAFVRSVEWLRSHSVTRSEVDEFSRRIKGAKT